MKRQLFSAIVIITASLIFPFASFAQENNNHTAGEEAEGKAVWEKLQAKELTCNDLSGDNFAALGEHFMGQMMGDSHEAMNNMMSRMMGEEGEKQMHIVMGKRISGCESNAPTPQGAANGGMMAMMMTMMGNFGANPMSWFGSGFGWIFMILFWGLIILGIIVLIKWLVTSKSPPRAEDILKERYAKGEIDKKEFEEKRKDLI